MSLLQIDDLCIAFPGKEKNSGFCEVVHKVSFHIEEGEAYGLVGESGSGKSVTALSLLSLLPENAQADASDMVFDGQNLQKLSDKEWQDLRGNRISMIYQEPMTSLNPVMTIEKQLEEVLLLHGKDIYGRNKELRKECVLKALEEANLKKPEELLSKYPHQLSGGMRQRVMIAMAMLCHPRLLIADEPTTALDAATEEAILELLNYYRKTYGTAVLFISHDLSLVRRLCDRVGVMKDGRLIESNITKEVFQNPKEEYTKKLLGSMSYKSYRTKNVVEEDRSNLLLRAEQMEVTYKEKRLFGTVGETKAVKNVSFSLYRGEILGLVGESGSGKSTLVRALTGLLPVSAGSLQKHSMVGNIPMVFQDPYGSLNPAKTVEWILEEPLNIQKKFSKKERKRLVIEALKEVELEEIHLKRHIWELSGGQRQRVAIAVALIQKPEVVILDEPVSALDVTVQDQILKLLCRLQKEHGMTYLFVSHDMQVVRKLCDRVMVLYQGELVEEGPTEQVFLRPGHPYTKKLIETRGANKEYAERKKGKEEVSSDDSDLS